MQTADSPLRDAEARLVFQRASLPDEHRNAMRVHRDAFHTHYERLGFLSGKLAAAPPLPAIEILVLTEDWCIDSVLNLPVLERLVEASPGASLRIADRSRHRALADRFPGRSGVSRVPTFIFLRGPDGIAGHWSERCRSARTWVEDFAAADPMPPLDFVDGAPSPSLAAWMARRFEAERQRFYDGVWREVAEEISARLALGSDQRGG